jgi:hypothetical protein
MLASFLLAAATPASAVAPTDPIAADWRAIPDDQLLVMTLAGGRQVVMRLSPTSAGWRWRTGGTAPASIAFRTIG